MEYEITGLSYDISGGALILVPSDALNTGANSFNDIEGLVNNTLLYWRICLMEGTNNRTVVEEIAHGTGKLTQVQAQGQNKQNAQYNYTLTGYGAITVGTPPASGTD